MRPFSAGIVFIQTLTEKVCTKIVWIKKIKNKKHYERAREAINSFDKVYKKRLHDKVVDKEGCDFVIFLQNKWMKLKTNPNL